MVDDRAGDRGPGSRPARIAPTEAPAARAIRPSCTVRRRASDERRRPLRRGQVLTGELFDEPMRAETIHANGAGAWDAGLVGIRSAHAGEPGPVESERRRSWGRAVPRKSGGHRCPIEGRSAWKHPGSIAGPPGAVRKLLIQRVERGGRDIFHPRGDGVLPWFGVGSRGVAGGFHPTELLARERSRAACPAKTPPRTCLIAGRRVRGAVEGVSWREVRLPPGHPP